MSSEIVSEQPSRRSRHASPVPWRAIGSMNPVFKRPKCEKLPSDIFPNCVQDSLKKEDLLPTSYQFHMLFAQKNVLPMPDRRNYLTPYIIKLTENNVFYYAMPHKRNTFYAIKETLYDLVDFIDLCEDKDWRQVQEILQEPLHIQTDKRMCFQYEKHFFLTRKYFTLGERKVERNTQHVIQVGNRPFHILFPEEDTVEKAYQQKVLAANTVYRIPSPTRYILYTCNRTFFSLHIVEEGGELPFSDLISF